MLRFSAAQPPICPKPTPPNRTLPHQAKENGAKIIEINPTENSYRGITDVFIKEPSGEAMPRVLEHLRRLLNTK